MCEGTKTGQHVSHEVGHSVWMHKWYIVVGGGVGDKNWKGGRVRTLKSFCFELEFEFQPGSECRSTEGY